jgi:hypothetical protein
MSKFSDKSTQERMRAPDIAETAFQAFATRRKYSFERYGFNKSKLKNFYKLPVKIRYTPDFIVTLPQLRLVEVKSAHPSGTHFKLKEENLIALESWDKDMETIIFVNSPRTKETAFISVRHLISIHTEQDLDRVCVHGVYHDEVDKKYWEIPWSLLKYA